MDRERPLRILEVVHAFPPESFAGTEIYTYNLALALQRLGHQVKVLYPGRHPESEPLTLRRGLFQGVAVMELNGFEESFMRSFHNPEFDAVFEELLSRERFDVVHFQHLMRLSPHWVSIAREAGAKTALKIDDMFFYCAANHLSNSAYEYCRRGPENLEKCYRCLWGDWENDAPALAGNRFGELAYRKSVLRAAMAEADFVHFASRFVEADSRVHGLVPRLGRILYTGIGPFPRSARERRPGAPLRIGYLGAIHGRKGIQHFLSAVRRFAAVPSEDRACRVEFIVHGGEAGQPDLVETLAQTVSQVPNLEARGAFHPDDRGRILGELDLLVVPSTGENYPFVIREALWAGVPVLATRIAGVPEIIEDGKNGFLVEPGEPDALLEIFERVAADPGLLAALDTRPDSIKTIEEDAHELSRLFSELVGEGARDGSRAADPVLEAMRVGREQIEAGAYAEALRVLGEARAEYGDHPQLLLGLGVASFHLGNPHRAYELLQDAHQLHPTDPDIAVSWAAAAEKLGRLADLREPLARAYAAAPNDAELRQLYETVRGL
jgi:glycosyltransferase involved in cell wall biosynthesis